MARMTIDCRSLPTTTDCTVAISGEPDEVLALATAHAVSRHGHTDDAELREILRAAMRDEDAVGLEPGAFLQLIEFHTRTPDRFTALADEWRERIGTEATARWAVVAADRDRPDVYLELVAFPDFAAAMRNSEHPVTSDFAKQMQEAIDGEAGFRNLDVRELLRM
jgi:plasmid stability protein